MEIRVDKASRIDSLKIKSEGGITYYYYEGDIVRISRFTDMKTHIEGRISWIDTSKLQLDISEKYDLRTREIVLDDISTIELIKREELKK